MAARHERVMEPSWSATSVTAELKRLPRAAADETDAVDAADPTRVVVPNTPSHRADAGLAWGTLVHGLLEHAMRHRAATRDDLRRLGQWLTVEEPRLRPMVDLAVDAALAVVSSPELASARASADCHEEVPFAIRDTTGVVPRVVTGAIDLVHRAPRGGWQLIDYKTDIGLDAAAAEARYAAQVQAYTDAWRRIAGEDVRTAIVAARPKNGVG
jgi:ATP-dependent exoDNAse (exonuclease V) beta subunit